MNCSKTGFPILLYIPELTQTYVRWVSDVIQPSPLSSASPPAFYLSQQPALRISWPKYWNFSFRSSPSNEYSRLISLRSDWFDLPAVQGTLKSLLQHHSSKASVIGCSFSFMVQLLHPYMTTGKTITLTIWTFVSKVMPLLFNTLSRFVIDFLPKTKHLFISWLQSPIKSVTVSTVSPSICHKVMGPYAIIFIFWMLDFKLAFSLSSFTFIQRFFSSSSLSAIRVVSSAYLRLLIFLPEIWIPVCDSSSPVFCMMYSAYKLNKQGDRYTALKHSFPNFEPTLCSISSSNCCFLTCIQVSQEAVRWCGIPISLRILYSLFWSTQLKALA